MARKGFRAKAREAVPKIFQTFNSLLGSIVRKKNATIVGPSKQLVGEFPEVSFERLYQFYHHWDQIKRSVDTMHQKLVGAGIEINSNNEYFNIFIDKWWKTVNADKKFNEYILSTLITGNGIMEIQYTPDGRLGNVEHIPMQTIFRIFRDQFANELKLVQIVDGVFKELDPQFFTHWLINNPDRQAFGKSEFFSLASPRPVAGKVDQFTGESINPDRSLRSLLDSQAVLQNAEVEIKEKMGKPRLLVSAPGMPRDQMEEVQKEMANPQTDQYIWIFDKPIDSKELQIQAQSRFDDYGDNVDAHIDIGTGFASKVISNPSGFSYSGSQTPLDVLDQRMIDLQLDIAELIKDKILKPLAESWGFKEFDEMEIEVSFTPKVNRLNLEDIGKLNPEAVSPKEIRELYKKQNIGLDDTLYEEFQNELTKDKTDQKQIGLVQAQSNGFGGNGDNGGFPPPTEAGAGKPPKPPSAGGGTSERKTPERPDNEEDRPEPPRTDKQMPSPFRRKKGESLTVDDIGTIVEKAVEATLKAKERITLPPSALDSSNDSTDLYVSQGLDQPGVPEITDPSIRDEYGLDKDKFEKELPPNAPQRRADVVQSGGTTQYNPPDIDPEGGTGKLMQPHIPEEAPQVSVDDYVKELETKIKGDHTEGGTGDERINADSDGSFKDPNDLAGTSEEPPTPETGNTDNKMPHAGPVSDPILADAQDKDQLGRSMTGGSQAEPSNTKQQELGSFDKDIPPIVPSEGDPAGDSELNKKKKIDTQQTRASGQRAEELGPEIQPQIPDRPETYHKDKLKPEDSDPRLPMKDPNPHLNQPQKGQARLDDSPLFEEPKGDSTGINPSRDRDNAGTPNGEEPMNLKNNVDHEGGTGNAVDPAIGQSDQVRLKRDELTGVDDASKLPTIGDPSKDVSEHPDNTELIDQSGLNMSQSSPVMKSGDYEEQDLISGIKKPDETPLDLQDKTIQDPLGNVPNDDGMLVKPQDVQQASPDIKNSGISDMPDPNANPEAGQNIDQGVDPNEINPEELHQDPETGKNYTDLTDEQGNEVPDLRFDQTPDSDDKQPDVELDNEIVTKEEYDNELEKSRHAGGMDPNAQDPMQDVNAPDPNTPVVSEDEFNNELNKQSTDPNALNPFEQPQPESPTQDTGNGSPEAPTQDAGNGSPEIPQKGDSQKSETPKSTKSTNDVDNGEKPKKTSPKKLKNGNGDKEKENGDKKPTSSGQKKPTKDEKPDQDKKEDKKLELDDVIKRKNELLEKGIDQSAVNDILVDEFGDVDSADEAEGMRIQSEQVFINPDGKVIGAPRFLDKRKKKPRNEEAFIEQEHPRDQGGKFSQVGKSDTRFKERKNAIRKITDTFPNAFPYERAGSQAIKSEGLQNQHLPRVKKVHGDLSKKFSNIEFTGRVKDTYSMLEKLARKPDEYKDVSDLQDISGVRGLCKSIGEVNEVRGYIKSNYTVFKEENYVEKSKGGYRSVHMTIMDEGGLPSEIQIRTPNQDKWANWAHEIYKPENKEMRKFVKQYKDTITAYSEAMSEYFYSEDSGKPATKPECPPVIEQKVGCIT